MCMGLRTFICRPEDRDLFLDLFFFLWIWDRATQWTCWVGSRLVSSRALPLSLPSPPSPPPPCWLHSWESDPNFKRVLGFSTLLHTLRRILLSLLSQLTSPGYQESNVIIILNLQCRSDFHLINEVHMYLCHWSKVKNHRSFQGPFTHSIFSSRQYCLISRRTEAFCVLEQDSVQSHTWLGEFDFNEIFICFVWHL